MSNLGNEELKKLNMEDEEETLDVFFEKHKDTIIEEINSFLEEYQKGHKSLPGRIEIQRRTSFSLDYGCGYLQRIIREEIKKRTTFNGRVDVNVYNTVEAEGYWNCECFIKTGRKRVITIVIYLYEY